MRRVPSEMTDDQIELRRYALLQATATLAAAEIGLKSEWTIRDLVDCAEGMLEEIEKREP